MSTLAEAFRTLGARFKRAHTDDYLDELVQLIKDLADHEDTKSLDGSLGGIAIGAGSKKKVLLGNTVTALVAGTRVALTTAEYAFTATGHDIAKSSQAYFLYTLDDAGAVTVTKGADHASAAVRPTPPVDEYVLGEVKLVIGAGAIFDATSDDLDAGHITDTYADLLGWLAADLALAQTIALPSNTAC